MTLPAFSVSLLVLAQVTGALTAIDTAPVPVFTVTSPPASMVPRSPAFSTEFFAVGVQTPPEQLICFVAAFEMTTEALAGHASTASVSVEIAIRFMARLLLRRVGDEKGVAVVDARALRPHRG